MTATAEPVTSPAPLQPRTGPASADASLPPVPGATGPLVVPTAGVPVAPTPVAVPVVPVAVPVVARRRRRGPVLLIVGLLVAAGVGVAAWFVIGSIGHEETDDAFIDADTVHVAPQVAGRVLDVLVRDNQRVHKGDELVQIDTRDYDVAVTDARAGLAEAQGKLDQAKAQELVSAADADQADAEVLVAQANEANAAADLKRYQALGERAVSRQLRDAAQAAALSTAAQVTAAKQKAAAAHAQVGLSATQVTTADAVVGDAQAKLDQAMLNRGYADLKAPIDGYVTRKTVQAGNYVQVGQQLLALVPVQVYVTANFKETQLDRMRHGDPVELHVDAYPGHSFHGHVDSVQAGTGSAFSLLPPENATGNFVKVVQRVPVKIDLDGDDGLLLAPGMSVEPDVTVK